MPTQEEKQTAVSAAVDAFAAVETSLDKAETKIEKLRSAIKACHALEIGKQGEYLKIVKLLKKAEGDVATVLADVITIHEKCTSIAKREECDIPANYAIDGGVAPMSGSPR